MGSMLLFLHDFRIFFSSDSMNYKGYMSPVKWWVVHVTSAPMLQFIALKLIGSFSCCERN